MTELVITCNNPKPERPLSKLQCIPVTFFNAIRETFEGNSDKLAEI